ncbi:hypothetical protein RT97_23095 [Variovorax paradoxus]|jgi:hypothetical protein|uniref:DUF4148 domain-containing protein n=1 Tax=Variovorax paradoxus TaxID=34073 RepID=A0A0D0M6A1_VARPD|nr:hypothetical protein [Variovorax paradoxus]KIQ26144.1 hypothetical protein RT97_23095 [Variovorax paradoxus]
MKLLLSTCALVGAQILALNVHAQPQPADKGAVRAERKAEGVEAARNFMPGEGDPIPEPKAKASKADRAAARQARKPGGVEAARTFMPGEGDPIPEPTAKLSRAERSAGRKASRAEVARENKAGELPSFNDNYGGK